MIVSETKLTFGDRIDVWAAEWDALGQREIEVWHEAVVVAAGSNPIHVVYRENPRSFALLDGDARIRLADHDLSDELNVEGFDWCWKRARMIDGKMKFDVIPPSDVYARPPATATRREREIADLNAFIDVITGKP